MKSAPIRPAVIVHDADGTPRSAAYDDVYHPRSGALAQASHVFLDDGRLAERWRGRERFVILETGFGLGTNFLATWAAWRADPQRCRQLHFLSIEAAPPSQADLRAAARDPTFASLAAELAERWPPLTWGLHRFAFDADGVELLLAFGDVAAWLPQLVARVDAFFLDGFAPARNPAMWDARVFKAMARLAAPDATAASWTAARAVRDGLRAAGFEVELAAGSGGKRDITRARFAPRFTPRAAPRQATEIARTQPAALAGSHRGASRPVVIVGAGLAGCALAGALARVGRSSLLLERRDEAACEGSGNAAGVFHGVVHRVDGRHARFHRAAAWAARDAVQEAIRDHGVRGSVGGLLRVEFGAADRGALQSIIDALGLPPDCVQAFDAAAASELAGVAIAAPAWYHPHGGWVEPRGLARAALAQAGGQSELRTGCAVAQLRREAGEWVLLGATGAIVADADTVVLCNAGAAFDLLGGAPWPVERQRGQTSGVAVTDLPPAAAPRLPLTGAGYVVPAIDGTVWCGASAQWGDGDVAVRPADHLANLERLARLVGVPVSSFRIELAKVDGRAGFRWQSRDRLPIIGAVPAALTAVAGFAESAPISARLDQPRWVPRAPGLFVFSALGSRGIAASALGARMLAAMIAGAPLPVEADLLDAVDPARFLVRRFRHDEASRQNRVLLFVQPPVGPMAGSAGA